MTLGGRIRELRRKAGLTQSALAERIGYSTKASISKIESDVLDVNQSTIVALAKALGVTPSTLMGWDDEENNPEKSNIAYVIKDGIYNIPLYESVSAGFGGTAQDCIIDYIPTVIRNPYEAKETIAIKVAGDSMYPKIEDGDTIVIHKQDSVDSGQIAVVLIDGEDAVVKKVKYDKSWVDLISINPEYKTRHFEKEEVNRLRVLGLVKQIIKTV